MTLNERVTQVVKEIGKDIKGLRSRVTVLESRPTSSDTVNESQVETIANRVAEEKVNRLIGGAPATFDTLKEIADYIESDKSGASAMAESINKRLRIDEVQTLTQEQKEHVLTTLGLNTDVDLVAEYKAVVNG